MGIDDGDTYNVLDAPPDVVLSVSVSDGADTLRLVGTYDSVCLSPRFPIRFEGCANVACPRKYQGQYVVMCCNYDSLGIVGGAVVVSWMDSGACGAGYPNSVSTVFLIAPMRKSGNY